MEGVPLGALALTASEVATAPGVVLITATLIITATTLGLLGMRLYTNVPGLTPVTPRIGSVAVAPEAIGPLGPL